MKISPQLQSQIERLKNTGAFGLSKPQKEELRELTKQIGCTELKQLDCGTCLRDAMYNVIRFLDQKTTRPKLQMKMVKTPDEMTYQELRAEAKRKGIKLGSNPTKQQLKDALK